MRVRVKVRVRVRVRVRVPCRDEEVVHHARVVGVMHHGRHQRRDHLQMVRARVRARLRARVRVRLG